jgi:hypothetical protein
MSKHKDVINAEWLDENWQTVIEMLPIDLETSAEETAALVRRRKIKSASDLLRLNLLYSVCDFSLRMVGAWALLLGIGYLSDVAIMKRLQKSVTWLQELIQVMLARRNLALRAGHPVRVRVIDGSSISHPGSQGTDCRLHASLDLASMRIDGIEITDTHSGETLVRHPGKPGEIQLADRGYGSRSGVGSTLAAKGDVVIRLKWRNFPMETASGASFDLFAWLRQIPVGQATDQPIWITYENERYPLRLIAQHLPQEAADRARQRLRRRASKKGHAIDKRSREAAGFLILVTSLDAALWTPAQLVALYRLRWQVELLFKRLKSLLDLDLLRAKDQALAQVYLLGKLLAALLIDQMTDRAAAFHPTLFADMDRPRPLSLWRWTALLHHQVMQSVSGYISWQRLYLCLPLLERYLAISQRKRPLHASLISPLLRRFAIQPLPT